MTRCMLVIAIAAAASMLAGCGVITVSVDVYKGPLANHRDVQEQQLAAMPMAAKPLLARLRYILEANQAIQYNPDPNNDPKHRGDRVELGRDQESRRQRLETLRGSSGWEDISSFDSPQADFVNRILAEYDSEDEMRALRKAHQYVTDQLSAGKSMGDASIAELFPTTGDVPESMAQARGRPTPGLETILYITSLRRAHELAQGRNSTVGGWYLDAITNFAQKILYAANQEPLIKPKGLAENLFDDGVNFLQKFTVESGSRGNGTYELLLQAIGNSIIVQLDSLQQEKTYLAQARAKNGASRPLDANAVLDAVIDVMRERITSESAPGELAEPATSRAAVETSSVEAFRDHLVAWTDESETKNVGWLNGELVAELQRQSLPANALDMVRREHAKHAKRLDRMSRNLLICYRMSALAEHPTELIGPVRQLEAAERASAELDPSVLLRIEKLVELRTFCEKSPSNSDAVFRGAEWRVRDLVEGYQEQQKHVQRLVDTFQEAILHLEQYVAELEQRERRESSDRFRRMVNLVEAMRAGVIGRVSDVPAGAAQPAGAATQPNDSRAAAILAALSAELQGINSPDDRRSTAEQVLAFLIENRSALAARLRSDRADQSTDSLEWVIDALRSRRLALVADAHADPKDLQSVEAALAVAYEQRSEQMFIRPASSYLRTSTPATSLQPDSSVGWRNQLGEHGLRQIPFYSSFNNWWHRDDRDQATIQKIDKQYWQNINTVRVAGFGDTNYAIVKDDIGNWYVKNYTADLKDVANTGANLATLAISGPAATASSLAATGGLRPSLATPPNDTSRSQLAFAEAELAHEHALAPMREATERLQAETTRKIAKAWRGDKVLESHREQLETLLANTSKTCADLPRPVQSWDDGIRVRDAMAGLRLFGAMLGDAVWNDAALKQSKEHQTAAVAIIEQTIESAATELSRQWREPMTAYLAEIERLRDVLEAK